MDFLRGWILNIVSIVLVLLLTGMLVPSGKTKKFVNLVSGFILIIAIITPVLSLLSKGIDIKDFQIRTASLIDKKELEDRKSLWNEKQMKQIGEIYRKKLSGHIENIALNSDGVERAEADAVINEDYESESFGEIRSVYLKIFLRDEADMASSVEKVGKIQVGASKNSLSSEEKGNEEERIEKGIKEKLINTLGISEENIIIYID
jgi:stage III sporulation protein AF